jgi:predicted nucleic acid-binding protein
MKKNGEPKILLDCDVVIHFLKGGKILELPTIFPGRFVMLDKVQNELHKRNSNVLAIGVFLATAKVPVIPMPTDTNIVKEYLLLKKTMDDGEAACLAVARFQKDYVASSNITQIASYCKDNDIVYYTTMDLLQEASVKGIMDDTACNLFIAEVKNKGSRLPCNTIAEYRKIKGIGVLKKS